MEYVKSDEFAPEHDLDERMLKALIEGKVAEIGKNKKLAFNPNDITNVFNRNSDISLFHNSKYFAVMKTIFQNSFRRLRCNEVPGICHANSLSKQGFDSGKH